MPMTMFAEPFVTRLGNEAIPDNMKMFLLTAKIDKASGDILANIRRSGSGDLSWIVDHNGMFYHFVSLGLMPATIFQQFGLTKRQERYQVEGPRQITVGEFLELAKPLKDRFREAPFSKVVRSVLSKFELDRTVDREVMVAILGE